MSTRYFRPQFSPFSQVLASEQVSAYLERLAIVELPDPSIPTLRTLHYLHPQVFPFESLSPLLGVEIDLTIPAIFKKMVMDRRGGYCFEHNLLFGAVLTALGFSVKSLAARVLWKVSDDKLLPRDHLALLVQSEGVEYLVDVGFGGNTMTAPLVLHKNGPQDTSHERFQLTKVAEHFVLSIEINQAWREMYYFGLEEYLLPDYQVISWYLGTHPSSIFTKDLMAALTRPDRRFALKNNQFTIHHKNGVTEKRLLQSPNEVLALLQSDFGINIAGLPLLSDRLKAIPWEN
jgi:N-hydroxyarylamine O-acetyltransferase